MPVSSRVVGGGPVVPAAGLPCQFYIRNLSLRKKRGKREMPFPRRPNSPRDVAPGNRRKAMRIWRRKGKEVKGEQKESGKLMSVPLSNKSGEPILGVSLPKSEDRGKKLREQSKELRGMAERLDLMADEMERED